MRRPIFSHGTCEMPSVSSIYSLSVHQQLQKFRPKTSGKRSENELSIVEKRREYKHLSSPKDGGTTTAEHNESEGSSLSMIVCDQKTAVRPLISPNLGLPSALLLVPSWFPRPLLQDRPFGMRGGFECSAHWPLLHQKRSRN